ncbi:MAG TPA: UDP-glucose/GDP-mannose dehydrogenase family protein, partial [Gemmatimonadales bacterium]|nr:UDP-glucose/GDP-mannose dehydrogenase family protein [Gemmatimonadales bacterium]
MTHIAVVGSGYVGLVAGACFAETGNDVVCADIDRGKIDRLVANDIPIYEPGLEELVRRNQAEGRLRFTSDVGGAVEAAQVVFIAVGTPPGEDGSADLKHVLAVASTIGRHMRAPTVVVTKSTVPVGTAAKVRAAIAAESPLPFAVCSNPEFLKEGAAIDDFMKPDRVVIGVEDDGARELLRELYAPFVRNGNPILFMDIASAEVTKYAANAMLATRISFINQVAQFCELVGADVDLVRRGIGSDRRIGPAFLFPGPGYGGSCFPKDVK